MKLRYAVPLMLLGCCMACDVFAYGEGSYITMGQRAFHLVTNEARTDTAKSLARCGSNCAESERYYRSLPPLYWNDRLGMAAQFYTNLLSHEFCIQHEPPCTLKKNIYENISQCYGDPSCACEEGQIYCGKKFGKVFDKVHAFMKGYKFGTDYFQVGENLVYSSAPNDIKEVLDILLLENYIDTDGHRKSILSPEYNSIGCGYNGNNGVQEFGMIKKDHITNPISSGATYATPVSQVFAMHYYDQNRPAVKGVLVFGQNDCYQLNITTGNPKNGIFSITDSSIDMPSPNACTPFYFEMRMSDGTVARYPTTGSLLYGNCYGSWKDVSAPRCLIGPYEHEIKQAKKKVVKYKKETQH